MKGFWFLAAAVVFFVALAAHLTTFVGIDPLDRLPGIMWVHLAVVPPGFAAIIYATKVGGSGKDAPKRILAQVPMWLRGLVGLCFAYAFVDFALFMFLSHDGSPEVQNGRYVLMDHSRMVRPLTAEEYHLRRARIVRGFSGHWMFFSVGAMALIAGAARMESF